MAIFDPERDRELAFRYGQDIGVMAFSAHALLALGEFGLARQRVEDLAKRTAQSSHAATVIYGLWNAAQFEFVGRNSDHASPLVQAVSNIAHEHQMGLWVTVTCAVDGWVKWRSGDREAGLLGMRRGKALQREQGVDAFAPVAETTLAEIESEAGEVEAALATIDEALEASNRSGQRWFDAETHRIRGEILLKQNPSDPPPPKRRSRPPSPSREARKPAASNCAPRSRSQNSIARPAATPTPRSGPALEGFAPTPEFPEIAEAQALLVAIDAGAHVRH